MLEVRLGLDPSRTQSLTTALLAIHGVFSLISAPIIAHFADKTPNKKIPLLISLAGCFVGTVMVALTPSRMLYSHRHNHNDDHPLCTSFDLLTMGISIQYGHFFWVESFRVFLDLAHGLSAFPH